MKSWCYFKLRSGERIKIDKEDLEKLEKYPWRVRRRKDTVKLSVQASVREGEKVKTLVLGKFLMKPPKGKQVYPRRYMDGLDYRKSNLIVCTVQERQRMLPKRRANTSSDFKGVAFMEGSKKWRASIEVDGESINLGEFSSEREAAEAYNRAARKYFKKFAYQNRFTKKNLRKR